MIFSSEAQITNISGVDVDTLVPSLNIEFNSDPANTGSDKLFETDSGVYKIYVANSAVVSLWTVGSTPLLVSGTSDNKLYLLTGVADADAGGADAGKKVLTLEEMPDSSSYFNCNFPSTVMEAVVDNYCYLCERILI